jgi:hypothetical protein
MYSNFVQKKISQQEIQIKTMPSQEKSKRGTSRTLFKSTKETCDEELTITQASLGMVGL